MYQIQFRLGLLPGPRRGAYSAPPDLLDALRGLLLMGGEGTERDERGVECSRVEGTRRDDSPPLQAP